MTRRTLDLPRNYKRRLLHLRFLCGSSTAPVLSSHDVERVEKELGIKLGDALLALVALRTSLLDEFEVRLTMLPRHTRDVHAAGMARGLVGIGRHPDGNVLLAASPLGTQVHRLQQADGDVQIHSVESWLEELCSLQRERLRDKAGQERARGEKSVTDDAVDAFEIVIEASSDGPRVRHTKFGGGTILRELAGGKVEVRFDGGEIKTLMRSFLQDE
ncbi:MAG: hypothetical protein AAF645_14925 [Myxococcota bacterium]